MKTFKNLLQSVIFVLMITVIIPVNAQEISINGTFSSDTTFDPFTGQQGVYSFKMSGGIDLLSDSSLIRVVLIDSIGNHYLIYEAYPLITTSNSFPIENVCDETCYLDGIIPDTIRVDIINAIVSIEKFIYDLTPVKNIKELQEQVKWVNDSIKIAIINQRIQQEHMYWRAGRTGTTDMFFQEKENRFGNKFNGLGYEFYKGGIFKRIISGSIQTVPSDYVGFFDWRYRHNANVANTPYWNGRNDNTGWITSGFERDQLGCNTCWLFASVGATESALNLYYNVHDRNNPHHTDMDISEMDVWKCPTSLSNCGDLGNITWGFNGLKSQFRVDEEHFKYKYNYTSTACSISSNPPPPDYVKIEEYKQYSNLISRDDLKETLIKNGPVTCNFSNFLNYGPHSMVLVGYRTYENEDTVYHGTGPDDPDIIFNPQGDPNINKLVWTFKDSHYSTAPVFPEISDDDFGLIDLGYTCGTVGKIYWNNYDPIYSIKCSDEDGDGYYWWGIHRDQNGNQIDPQQCNCPPGVVDADEEDCDDNNVNSGPYDLISTTNKYSCKPNDCTTSNTPLSLCSTCPNQPDWSKDQHINKDLIVESDYTVTITNQVFFSPGAKIIVKPRAKLILQGSSQNYARLTSSCGKFWGGIVLDGDPTLPQTEQNQGVVKIDYGTIENAVWGIKTTTSTLADVPGVPNPGDGHATGGIIYADNAKFHNNIVGVEFFPYRDYDYNTVPITPKNNLSYFRHCMFYTDDGFFNTDEPYCLLKLDGVNTINIRGCGFKNYMSNASYPHRGKGIHCFISQLDIKDDNGYPSSFEKLNYGIYGIYGGFGIADFKIYNALFTDNAYGIYLSAYSEVNVVDIRQNSFSYQKNYNGSVIYGLYLDHCSSFTVTKNYFIAYPFDPPGSKPDIIGIIVNNAGAKTNYVYNNYNNTNPAAPSAGFKSLYTGVQGQNINRGIYQPDNGFPYPWLIETGLRFVCNDFEDCDNDIADIKDDNLPDWAGITHFQRNSESTVGTQQPAGNTFSTSHFNLPPNSDKYDIEIDPSPEVKDILYKYHTDPPNSITKRLWPNVVNNPGQVNYDPYNDSPYNKTSSCPDFPQSNISKEGLESVISQASFKIDSLINLLHYLTDNGSTDSLKNTVENSFPNQSYDVYQGLMNVSPFLSDTVLKTSIIKEDVLQNTMIRDIMVANPQSAKSEDLLNTLDNRYNPLPDSMWAEILESRDTVGAMEQLQSELSGWVQLRDMYFSGLISYFLHDTIDENPSDSLTNLLQNDFNLISRYNLITYYLKHYNFTQAQNVLQEISNDFTLTSKDQQICQNFSDLITIVAQLVNDTSGYNIPDSNQTEILRGLLTDDYNLPGAYARNILIASGLLNYQEPILTESSQKSSRIVHDHGDKIKKKSDFKVYPNPCKDYLIVEYTKEKPSDLAVCSILNASGNSLDTYVLNKTSNQIIIPFQSYPSGTYFIRFQVNGASKALHQIVKIN